MPLKLNDGRQYATAAGAHNDDAAARKTSPTESPDAMFI